MKYLKPSIKILNAPAKSSCGNGSNAKALGLEVDFDSTASCTLNGNGVLDTALQDWKDNSGTGQGCTHGPGDTVDVVIKYNGGVASFTPDCMNGPGFDNS